MRVSFTACIRLGIVKLQLNISAANLYAIAQKSIATTRRKMFLDHSFFNGSSFSVRNIKAPLEIRNKGTDAEVMHLQKEVIIN
jgi:hypothetical protein